MAYDKMIQRWRADFTTNNRRLWEARHMVFQQQVGRMLQRLKKQGEAALTRLAEELREAGVYVQSNSRKQCEYMILVRLYRSQEEHATWDEFLKAHNINTAP